MWNPNRPRQQDPNPLFKLDDNESYTVKSLTPEEQIRQKYGTPVTTPAKSNLRAPGPQLYLNDLRKSEPKDKAPTQIKADPPLTPDMVVKAFMKGDVKISYKDDHGESVDLVHEEDEETKKAGLAAAAKQSTTGKVAQKVRGAVGGTVSSAVGLANRTR